LNDVALSGVRFLIGILIMGVIVPVTLFMLLNLQTISQLLVIAATTFLGWGVGDLLATILEKPRLHNRTPGQAFREDLERRSNQ
jgi:hypothetical protein